MIGKVLWIIDFVFTWGIYLALVVAVVTGNAHRLNYRANWTKGGRNI